MATHLSSQVMAGQFDKDPAKAKSREFLKQKILEAFPDHAQRERLTAVFFTGPSLVEADQIFLAAGLKPENITGVERDPKAFAAVKAQNDARPEGERIRLFHGNDTELFAQGARYGVISLDYVQNYGPEMLASLDAIFDKGAQSLDEKTVLAINLQARREQPKYQARLLFLTNFSMGLWLSHSQHAIRANKSLGLKRDVDEAEKAYNLAYDQFAAGAGMLLDVSKTLRSHSRAWKFGKFDGALDAMRLGVANEVYVRTEFPVIRECTMEDLRYAFERNPRFSSRSFDDYLRFMERFDEYSYSPGESLKDPLRLSLFGYCMPCVLFAVGNVPMFAESGEKMRDKMARNCTGGLIMNEISGTPIVDYSHHQYVSSSRTPMLMQVFTIMQPFSEKETAMEPGDAEDFGRMMGILGRIFSDSSPRYSHLRLAAGNFYGKDVNPLRLLQDIRLWQGFRAGQELLSCIRSGGSRLRSQLFEYGSEMHRLIELRTKTQATLIGLAREQQEYYAQFRASYNAWLKRLIAKARREGKLVAVPAGGVMHFFDVAPKGDGAAPENDGNGNGKSNGKGQLSGSDKEAIREFAREGMSPGEIHESFFTGTSVTIGQVRAVVAWNKIYDKKKQAQEAELEEEGDIGPAAGIPPEGQQAAL